MNNKKIYHSFKKKLSQYSLIPEKQWEKASQIIKVQKILKGESFIEIEDSSQKIGFIEEGLFKVCYPLTSGKSAIRAFCKKGSFIGAYSCVILDKPSNVYIEAIEDSEVLYFLYPNFMKLFNQHECWSEIGHKLAQEIYIFREKREFEFLAYSAKERYFKFADKNNDLLKRIQQKDIAAYLGMSPVSLSRIISKRNKIRRTL